MQNAGGKGLESELGRLLSAAESGESNLSSRAQVESHELLVSSFIFFVLSGSGGLTTVCESGIRHGFDIAEVYIVGVHRRAKLHRSLDGWTAFVRSMAKGAKAGRCR